MNFFEVGIEKITSIVSVLEKSEAKEEQFGNILWIQVANYQ